MDISAELDRRAIPEKTLREVDRPLKENYNYSEGTASLGKCWRVDQYLCSRGEAKVKSEGGKIPLPEEGEGRRDREWQTSSGNHALINDKNEESCMKKYQKSSDCDICKEKGRKLTVGEWNGSRSTPQIVLTAM